MTFKYPPIIERFEQNYIPEPNSGCWLWLGALNKQGYGGIKDGRPEFWPTDSATNTIRA